MPGTYLAFFFFFFLAFVAGVLFPVFFAACFFAVFFFVPFVAAAFLAAFFFAGAFLLPVVPDFSEDFCAVLLVVFMFPLLASFLLLGTAASTGFVSNSRWTEIFGSTTAASTTRTCSGSTA